MHQRKPSAKSKNISLRSIPEEPLRRGVERWYHERDRVRFTRDIGSRLSRHKIDPDPWQARALESGSKRILMNCARQVGKSTVVGALTLHKAMFTPESLSLIVTPTERQAKITFAKVARFYMAAGGDLSNASYAMKANVKKMALELPNGSEVIALPGNPDTVRGFSPDLVILDEAPYMEDDLYIALRPSLAATDGDLIALGTPNGKQGWFYEAWENREEQGWDWYEVPATLCPRISPEFLEEERRSMPAYKYRQEYECSFEDTSDTVFATEDIHAAFSARVEAFTTESVFS